MIVSYHFSDNHKRNNKFYFLAYYFLLCSVVRDLDPILFGLLWLHHTVNILQDQTILPLAYLPHLCHCRYESAWYQRVVRLADI